MINIATALNKLR